MFCKLILDRTEGHILRKASPTEGHLMTLLKIAWRRCVEITELLPCFIQVRQYVFWRWVCRSSLVKTLLQIHRRCPALLLDDASQKVLLGSQSLLALLGPV